MQKRVYLRHVSLVTRTCKRSNGIDACTDVSIAGVGGLHTFINIDAVPITHLETFITFAAKTENYCY